MVRPCSSSSQGPDQGQGARVESDWQPPHFPLAKILVYKYTSTYRGTENWKGNRLQRLESATDDNGTRFTVNAVAEGNQLRVKVNGQERFNRGDAWTTSYWHLPEAKFRNGG